MYSSSMMVVIVSTSDVVMLEDSKILAASPRFHNAVKIGKKVPFLGLENGKFSKNGGGFEDKIPT